jgi:DNA-binding HxlR family transcriptional regulator
VEYELTPLGQSLHAPIEAITDWAEANVNKVMAARETLNLGLSLIVDQDCWFGW